MTAGRKGFWARLAEKRAWVQLSSTVLLNSWFTQQATKGVPCLALNCHACPLAVTSCPIGGIQHFVSMRQLPLYVLGVVGLAGAVWGRAACGWLCPFGWLQELLHRVRLPKLVIQPRQRARWWGLLAATALYVGLGWALLGLATQSPVLFALYLVAGVVLYAFLGASQLFALLGLVLVVPVVTIDLWFCKLCPAGMLEGGIPQVLIDANLRGLVGGFFWLKLAILVGFLAWMAVTRRPFCRWICPLGALWSLFNRWSTLRMAVDRDACIECNRCQEVCPVDIRIYEDADAPACVRCLLCVSECPVSCIGVEGR